MEQFAAARDRRLRDFEAEIAPLVERGLDVWDRRGDWAREIIEGAQVLWLEIFEKVNPDGDSRRARRVFAQKLRATLVKTTQPARPVEQSQVDRIATWVGVYALNHATFLASRTTGEATKTWITMGDEDVRTTHRSVAGQTIEMGASFRVGEARLRFPGEPVGPIEGWINCRCVLSTEGAERSIMSTITAAAAVDLDVEEDVEVDQEVIDAEDLVDDEIEVPIHGVLVVEGFPTGDRRMFEKGALGHRNLPLPIFYQRLSGEGHGGSVSLARIERIERVEGEGEQPNLIRFWGAINTSVPESQEVIDGIVFGNLGGLSVDVDDAVFEVDFTETDPSSEDEMRALFGDIEMTRFTSGRICGATIVGIPAFQEAYVALGADFDEELVDPEAGVDGPDQGEVAVDAEYSSADFVAESTGGTRPPAAAAAEAKRGIAWQADGKAGSGLEPATVERARKIAAREPLSDAHIGRMASFFARHEIDKKAKGWAPGSIGYPSAGRVAWALWGGDAGKAFADAHMKRKNASSVESIEAAAFAPGTKDGPGWLTNPRATSRIRSYWTKGKGALKIRWGTPGDFNRCRRQLSKYVSSAFLAGTCANMHKEATGMWPGKKRGDLGRHSGETAPAFSIVASAANIGVPGDWFDDPKLTTQTPITVDEDGRIFGHIAAWGTCHIGIGEKCVTPPHSASNYSMFATGLVDTEAGTRRTGRVVMWTGHAGTRASAAAATRHYDDTGFAVADIAVGEDIYGIWFSGKVRDSATADEIATLRASSLSGDWRQINGSLELVGVLAVNVPGFPIPRTGFSMNGDQQLSLVASGVLQATEHSDNSVGVFGARDLHAIGRVVADELEFRQERRERLARARQLPEAAAKRRDELAAKRAERLARIRKV